MRYFMRRGVVLVGVLAAMALLPGCIVQEIRDDLKGVNAKLGTVETNLNETNKMLAGANERLTGVGGGLEVTNSSLSTLDERVRLLSSIEKSMVKLDAHLASLRGTIARIDSTIPFLDLGGDAPVETAAPAGESGDASVKSDVAADAVTGDVVQRAGGEAGEGAAKVSGGDAAGPGAAVAASTPRDAWVGPWVSADPRRTYTLVLMADGQYMREESYTQVGQNGQIEQSRVELGAWRREGGEASGGKLELILTPRDGVKDVAGNAIELRLRVLHQTTRTLTLSGGQGPRVLRKP
jgi:hypothetical protein